MHRSGVIRAVAFVVVVAAGLAGAATSQAADMSGPFAGKAVNGGTVMHETVNGKHVLTVSADFQVPGSPDPHWQVIDSKGNTYLLNRLTLKDDKVNRSITIPAYIPDIVKVQMWCAWAEVVLGEASFAHPVTAHATK